MERQRCFDYLLESMDAEERLRFEAQLTYDDQLAWELRSCEAELAAFAEASAPALVPPASVWTGIVDDLEASGEVNSDPFWKTFPWGRLAWPVAACLLLALNFWQFYRLGPRPAEQAAGVAGEIRAYDGGSEEEGGPSGATAQHLYAELESLRSQVGDVRRELSAELDEAERARTVTQVRLLRERRDDLEERIEFLESYYVALVELSDLAGEGAATGTDLKDGLGVELAFSQNLLLGGANGGIWSRLTEGLRDAPLVTLAMSGAVNGFGDPGALSGAVAPAWSQDLSFAGYQARQPPNDPYAFAFIDSDSKQAILTLGDLPQVAGEERMVLWARGLEEEGYQQVSDLPEEFGGRSVNVGVRLPEGASRVSDFLVTIETMEGDLPLTQPGERVVLQTVPSP